jgi:hypothetical protein
MGFMLFPDPKLAALTVDRNGGRVDTSFGQLTGAPLPEFSGIYARMMFIRVAMLGGSVAPTMFLRAGQGPPVAVSTSTGRPWRFGSWASGTTIRPWNGSSPG